MSALDSTHLRLVLLDRDGVINFDSPDFIKSPEEWRPIPGALEAIAALQARFKVAVCTNQSGLGRGLYDEAALADIHARLQDDLAAAGGRPLDVFFCPHHPDDGCSCRKPQPGLLEAALNTNGAAAAETVFAGDSRRDLEAAVNAGCHPVLLLSGNGQRTLENLKTSQPTNLKSHEGAESLLQATSVYQDLRAFADHLLAR